MLNNAGRIRISVLVTAAGAVLSLLLTGTAGVVNAAEPAPGSSRGGTPGPSAPAGVKVGTELPSRISVDNSTGATTLTARITNNGKKATPAVVLSVVGFGALKVTAVRGCSAVPAAGRPEGSNSAYRCRTGVLAAGRSRTYRVSATYDLRGKGRICLPVTLGTGGTLLWQQGPVPFGTNRPTPNAPDTPLLLGTDNVPAGQDASVSPAPSASSSPSGTLPGPAVPAPLPRRSWPAARCCSQPGRRACG